MESVIFTSEIWWSGRKYSTQQWSWWIDGFWLPLQEAVITSDHLVYQLWIICPIGAISTLWNDIIAPVHDIRKRKAWLIPCLHSCRGADFQMCQILQRASWNIDLRLLSEWRENLAADATSSAQEIGPARVTAFTGALMMYTLLDLPSRVLNICRHKSRGEAPRSAVRHCRPTVLEGWSPSTGWSNEAEHGFS